jgi:hypothetical protein
VLCTTSTLNARRAQEIVDDSLVFPCLEVTFNAKP